MFLFLLSNQKINVQKANQVRLIFDICDSEFPTRVGVNRICKPDNLRVI